MKDVVISTRIRLARNLADYPFPVRLDGKGKQEIIEKVKSAAEKIKLSENKGFHYCDMIKMSKTDALSLVENHLVSPEFVSNPSGRGLLLSDDNTISIMINEEDHLRIQVIEKGFELAKAFDIASKLDMALNEDLSFAYNDRLGYLTQCPTNLGTGMRASVLLHLPALTQSSAVGRISDNLSKLGLTVRGLYGEGSEPQGAMYQLSNQISLGISEENAINNLENITKQLVSQERKAREKICADVEVKDAISRSLGILRSAFTMSHNEAAKLLSNVRLGIESGIIKDIPYETVDELFTSVQPATLIKLCGEELSPSQRDVRRAELLKQKL